MNDVKVELEEVREESESGMQAAVAPARKRRRWMYAGGVAALAFIAAAAVWWFNRSQLPPPSAPIPLTAYEGDELWPDFSPDGNQVVFAWDGGPDGKFHLYVKMIGTSNHLQLTSGDGDEMFPAWSPDGRWIAFQRWDRAGSHTVLISPLGGPERKVGDGVCEAQLPVGPTPETAAFRLSWSKDSRQLVCSAPHGALVLVPAFGGQTRPITSPPKGQKDEFPAFAPDGHNLLFERAVSLFDCDLYLLGLNSDLSLRGQPRRITDKHAWLGSMNWTADGQDAVWGTVHPGRLYRVPVLRTGPLESLGFDHAIYPAVSNRQNRLAYVRWLENGDIWRTDGRITERHPLSSTEPDIFAHLSPDGKRIVFGSFRSGPLEIWEANADGTQAVQLTSFGRINHYPRWSPDGRWIVFSSVAADGATDLWAVDASGGTPRRLTNGPGAAVAPSFSHDGKWIYFTSYRTGRGDIFRVPFAGGPAIQVTRNGGDYSLESPDGKMIYYTKTHAEGGVLYRVPVTGGPEQSLGLQVIQDDFEVMREGIYYIAQTHGNRFRGGELRFYDFVSGHERLIQRLGDVTFFFGFSVSPDRKTFLYSAQPDAAADLMLVENFR
ncbi:MAG: PD40 domain-containing protein [Acidobacteriia bacterium]|nr:PD40 domain-containing protein [Terriglobia bacterium]